MKICEIHEIDASNIYYCPISICTKTFRSDIGLNAHIKLNHTKTDPDESGSINPLIPIEIGGDEFTFEPVKTEESFNFAFSVKKIDLPSKITEHDFLFDQQKSNCENKFLIFLKLISKKSIFFFWFKKNKFPKKSNYLFI